MPPFVPLTIEAVNAQVLSSKDVSFAQKSFMTGVSVPLQNQRVVYSSCRTLSLARSSRGPYRQGQSPQIRASSLPLNPSEFAHVFSDSAPHDGYHQATVFQVWFCYRRSVFCLLSVWLRRPIGANGTDKITKEITFCNAVNNRSWHERQCRECDEPNEQIRITER